MKANLFFINSPYQKFIADYIVQEKRTDFNMAIIDHRYNILNRKVWDNVLKVSDFYTYIRKHKLLKEHMNSICDTVNSYKHICIYSPSWQNFLANIVFNRLNNYCDVSMANFPEGIGNLRIIKTTGYTNFKLYMADIIKSVFAKYMHEKFIRKYSGSDRYGMKFYDEVYTVFPPALKGKVRCIHKINIPYKANKNDNLQPVCLYIDTRNPDVSEETWSKYLQNVAEFCKETFPGYRLLYKQHHRTKSMYHIFKSYDFVDYDSEEAIEYEIINGMKLNSIVATYSTALLMAKIIMGDEIVAVAYNPDNLIPKESSLSDYEEVKKIFVAAGVEWYV